MFTLLVDIKTEPVKCTFLCALSSCYFWSIHQICLFPFPIPNSLNYNFFSFEIPLSEYYVFYVSCFHNFYLYLRFWLSGRPGVFLVYQLKTQLSVHVWLHNKNVNTNQQSILKALGERITGSKLYELKNGWIDATIGAESLVCVYNKMTKKFSSLFVLFLTRKTTFSLFSIRMAFLRLIQMSSHIVNYAL